jgi:hypothetical protein
MKGSVYFKNNVPKFLRFKLLCDRRVSEHMGTKLRVTKVAGPVAFLKVLIA